MKGGNEMGDTLDAARAWTGPVHRLWALISDGGEPAHHVADLIFSEAGPRIVFEWIEAGGQTFPVVTLDLDPGKLREAPSPQADWLYEIPVRDPRSV